MQNIRIFKEKEFGEFEKFVKNNPPVGANGIKLNPNYLLLTYEDGEIRGKNFDIKHLKGELNTLLLNQLEEVRQLRDAIETLSTIDFYSRKGEWKSFRSQMEPMRRMCLMTGFKIKVVIDMLKDLEAFDSKQVSIFTVPELPEEPILAPEDKKKGR